MTFSAAVEVCTSIRFRGGLLRPLGIRPRLVDGALVVSLELRVRDARKDLVVAPLITVSRNVPFAREVLARMTPQAFVATLHAEVQAMVRREVDEEFTVGRTRPFAHATES